MALSIEELDREDLLSQAEKSQELEKQCRIYLSPDYMKGELEDKRVITLTWNPGTPRGRTSVILLKPGHHIVRPLWQAQSWFGPFAVWYDFKRAETEKEKKHLRDFYRAEKGRVLQKYGYPMGNGRGMNPDMTPIGPNRFPPITCTVIDSDGNDLEPMDLHEVYGIGAFDKAYPLESFGHRETAAEVEARLTAELDEQAKRHESAMEARDKQFAELSGMVKGLAVSVAGGKQAVGAAAGA